MSRAAGVLLVRPDGRVLLLLRSRAVAWNGCWGLPGGHVERGETRWEAARRETIEEIGAMPRVRVVEEIERSGYTTFVSEISDAEARRLRPRLNFEHDDWGWFGERLPRPLHPGLVSVLARL